jgi:hypothetical protein
LVESFVVRQQLLAMGGVLVVSQNCA